MRLTDRLRSRTTITAVLLIASLVPSRVLFGQKFWQPAGLADTNLSTLSINAGGKLLTASLPSNLLHLSTDGGTTWTTFETDSIMPAFAALDDSGFVYAADPDGLGIGLQRSSDLGFSWKILSDPASFGCYSLGVRPSGEIYATFAEFPPSPLVFHSTNRGDTWTKDSTGFSVSLLNNLSSQSVYAFNAQGTVFVIGTDGVYRSTDQGATWEKKVNGLAGTAVKTLCINSRGDIFVQDNFVGFVGNLYRSTDSGDSWSKVTTTGLPPFADFNQLAADGNNHLYGVVLGTIADGIYRSTDDGDTWTNVTAGLPTSFGTPTLFCQPGGVMYCATHGGLFRGTNALSSVGSGSVWPGPWKLEQNYPNPFNPGTEIRFQIAESGPVKLTVYNILGREVAILVNGQLAPGSYTVRFDARQLASGTYLCRLTAGGMTFTRKLGLVR